MAVLITGASGFSGAYIASIFSKKGYEVIAFGGSKPVPLNKVDNLTILQGNLRVPLDIQGSIDTVIHTASRSLSALTMSEDSMAEANIVSMQNTVEFAVNRGVKKFIFFSSVSVYGEISVDRIDPNVPIVNPDFYGKTKRAGELILDKVADLLPSVSLRLPGIIGPESHWLSRNWLSKTLKNAKYNQPIYISNPLSNFNNAVHILDLANFLEGLSTCYWRGSEILTLGALGEITVYEAVERLITGIGSKSRIILKNRSKKSFTINSDKACSDFGYAPMEIGTMLDVFAKENR